MARYVVRLAKSAGLIILFVLAAFLGTVSGVIFAFAGDLPAISALDDYAPSTITRVYGVRGEVVGEFSTQRRVVVPYEAISPKLRGASTITQQLARGLFPEAVGFEIGDVSPERKIKEAIVAVQIEKRYTKNEIFTFYANQMYLGEGAYGVEAAARTYFGKSAKDVTLDEAATLAGILQTWRNAPTANMERAKRRRGYVLQQMADKGFITQKAADDAKARPIVLAASVTQPTSIAPYFLEEVRKELEGRYGAKALYESGLAVQTGLDMKLQEAANRALDAGLRRVDRIHGFRKPRRNVLDERHTLDGFKHPRWDRPIGAGDIVPAVVTGVEAAAIDLRAGHYRLTIDRKGFA